jgi:hypothetical protein
MRQPLRRFPLASTIPQLAKPSPNNYVSMMLILSPLIPNLVPLAISLSA